jgi:hypothetical protein
MSKKLNNNNLQIKPKSGLKANINATATKNLAVDGELHYCTDTSELFLFNGTENVLVNRSTYSDYSLTQTGNLPTTWTKLNFSGASLVSETESLFDATNSRILQMNEGAIGQAAISIEIDTSTGSNHWVDMQLRGFDSDDVELFAKRTSTVNLVKNNSNDGMHEILEFYFGSGVAYFEVWIRASSAMPYTNPAITVIKL